MAARPRRFDYAQTVLGDCGHVCTIWPQSQRFVWSDEKKRTVREQRVICDECTAEENGIDIDVWVTFAKHYSRTDPEEGLLDAPTAVKPRKTSPRKKPVVCSICRGKGHIYSACPLLVGQQTLPLE